MTNPDRMLTIYIADDDDSMRHSIEVVVQSAGCSSRTYSSGQELLDEIDPKRAGCVILDLRMPGMDGIEVQRRLSEEEINVPIIFLTGYGDVPSCTEAFKAGALDFLEKPLRHGVLLERIHLAMALSRQQREQREHLERQKDLLAALSTREKEVLDLITSGLSNKQIALELDLSKSTVENHRHSLMQKTRAKNAADLVRLIAETSS